MIYLFFFSSRRRHTRFKCDWSSDVCSSDLGRQLGLLVFGKDANDRDKRVGIFRVVAAVLISKRNNEIAVVVQRTLAKARRDVGFDPVYNLSVKRQIIVRKIHICLRDDGQSKK